MQRSGAASDIEKELEALAELKVSGERAASAPDAETVATARLIETFEKYDPKVVTDESKMPNARAPLPISAELNYYAPLKHEVKYGDLKAEVVFKAFDPVNVEFFCDFALRAAYYMGLPATGPKPIPTKRERWTVIRAPFVHAKSKENFERKTHGRMIKIWDSDSEVVDLWLAYLKENSVWGVGVKVNMYTAETVKFGEEMRSIENMQHSFDDLSASLETLAKDVQNPVSQKVLELLKDPVFAKHLPENDRKKLE